MLSRLQFAAAAMFHFLVVFLVHGSLWLSIKSMGGLHRRAAATANGLWQVLLLVAVVFPDATWNRTLSSNSKPIPHFSSIRRHFIPLNPFSSTGTGLSAARPEPMPYLWQQVWSPFGTHEIIRKKLVLLEKITPLPKL